MCFTKVSRYRCGHLDIEKRQCRALETQEYQGQPKKATFWQRLFGRRGEISEFQCTDSSIESCFDEYCGPCLRAAARQRRWIVAKTKHHKQSMQAQMVGSRKEGEGQSTLSILQATLPIEQEKEKLLFRCSECKLAKRYPHVEERGAHSGLCCANGVAEFEQNHSIHGDSSPGSEYVQATSSAVRTDDRSIANNCRTNMPSRSPITGASEYRREGTATEANSHESSGKVPALQVDNPTGIDFVRWETTILRTDHGSYPGPSSSPPDEPLPTRPLLIRKATPAPGPASESGRNSSGPSSADQDVAPPIPSKHPGRAIRALPSPLPGTPPRRSSSRAIYESPGGTRIKPILKNRGVDAHYYPPPSPPPSPAIGSSHVQSPAKLHSLRRSTRRIEDLQLSSGLSDIDLGNPVAVPFPKRHVTFQLDLQASPVERGQAPRSNGEVPSRLEVQCDEIEELWLRSTG